MEDRMRFGLLGLTMNDRSDAVVLSGDVR